MAINNQIAFEECKRGQGGRREETKDGQWESRDWEKPEKTICIALAKSSKGLHILGAESCATATGSQESLYPTDRARVLVPEASTGLPC